MNPNDIQPTEAVETAQDKPRRRISELPDKVADHIGKYPKRYLLIFWSVAVSVFVVYNILHRVWGITIVSDPPSGFWLRTGVYCPGCGGTRMTHNFLIFRWHRAIVFNPIFFLLYVFSLGYMVVITIQKLMGRKASYISIPVVAVVFVSALLLFTLLRNFVPALQIGSSV